MKTLQLILLTCALGLAALTVFVEGGMDPLRPVDLDVFIERKMQRCGFPGLAVALVKDGEIAYAKGFGVKDIDTGEPVTDDTLFHIASVSKPIVATAVLQLVETERLSLDEDINTHLPFVVSNPHHPDEDITTRMLLTHSSSLRDDWEGSMIGLYTHETGGGDSPIPLEEFVRGYLEPEGQWYDRAANFSEEAPGTVYEYCNVGYALLGTLVEHVSGVPFDTYCQEYIFAPLQMEETRWFISDVNIDHLASPHAYDDGSRKLPHFGYPDYPSGTLQTSVAEYARFIQAMINDGAYPGGRILDTETVREMTTSQIPELLTTKGLGWDHLYALGKHFPDRAEELAPIHTGADPGCFAFAFYTTEGNDGAILFANGDPRESVISTMSLIALFKRLVLELEVEE